MTDNRYSHLHCSDAAIRMLEFAFEDEEQDFGKMTGFDEAIEVPLDFEPPQHDRDDTTLPSKSHPSYPFGRPQHLSHPATTSSTRVSLSRMRGRNGVGVKDLLGRLGMGTSSLKSTKTMWNDFGLHSRVGHNHQGLWIGMLEEEEKTEIPTGMAGAKRPPTPPSPAFRPIEEPSAEQYYTGSSRSGTPLSHQLDGPDDSFVSGPGLPENGDSWEADDQTRSTADTSRGEDAERRRRRRARREPVDALEGADEDYGRDPRGGSTEVPSGTWWEGRTTVD